LELRNTPGASPVVRKSSSMITAFFLAVVVILSSCLAHASSSRYLASSAQIGLHDAANLDSGTTNQTTLVQISQGGKTPAIFVLSSESMIEMRKMMGVIKEHGGSVDNVFPTHVAIGALLQSEAGGLLGESGVLDIYYGPVDASRFGKYGEIARLGAEFWNRKYFGLDVHPELSQRIFVEPPPIANDVRTINRTASTLGNVRVQSEIPYGAGFYDTSEYMLGSVTVLMIFPESNGAIDPNTETWTQSDIDAAVSEIIQGVNWWSDREPRAQLSFTFAYYSPSQTNTGYEPISRPSSDESLWITQIMNGLGFTAYSNYLDKVYDADNQVRNYYGTNWAYTIFVVNSKNDPDGEFSDSYFAYVPYLGAPFMVMTYKNDGYGISNMDAVTAHEMGHIFYANDQYAEAGRPCTERSGYLNIENQNSAYPYAGACLSNVNSIMRSQVAPYTAGAIDQYARQQVGWRDSNGNGILDIVDLYPQNTLYQYSPDPTTNTTPTYSGQASARVCYPNNNPYGQRHDITINTITGVQYWVEDSYGNRIRPTQDATPTDEQFNSDFEGYTFTVTPGLSPGTYRFPSVVWNNQGLGLIVWDVLTIESPVTVTITRTLTESSTSYLYRTTTTTTTSYTSTTTSTSTIPTVTTVVLVPLTITSTEQSTQFLTSLATTTVTEYTSTTTSTSTIPTTVALVPLTVTSTVQSTQSLTSMLTTTVTSYTGTETSTSTIVVPTTVVLVPSTVTSTVQSTQYLTSILTTTVTNYTGTETSTSTILVPTTIVLVPLTATSTEQSTQYLTSTATTTVTIYTDTQTVTSTIPAVTTVVLLPSTVTSTTQGTQYLTSVLTTTVTNYTSTTTSTSTSVVYSTVTASPGGAGPAGAGAFSSMAYPAFMTVLAITIGHRVTAGRPKRVPKVRAVSSPVQSYSSSRGAPSLNGK